MESTRPEHLESAPRPEGRRSNDSLILVEAAADSIVTIETTVHGVTSSARFVRARDLSSRVLTTEAKHEVNNQGCNFKEFR